jgi:hypothetical protein
VYKIRGRREQGRNAAFYSLRETAEGRIIHDADKKGGVPALTVLVAEWYLDKEQLGSSHRKGEFLEHLHASGLRKAKSVTSDDLQQPYRHLVKRGFIVSDGEGGWKLAHNARAIWERTETVFIEDEREARQATKR